MQQSSGRGVDGPGLALAGILLALAGVVLWDLNRLELTSVYGLGPKAMPLVTGGALALLAIANGVNAWRGITPVREPVDTPALLWILGGLAALIVLVASGAGFIPATAVLFAATAAGFGRRALATDLAIGAVLGIVTYLVFAKLLALTLPVGPIERLF